MAAPLAPARGPLEARIRSLIGEIFVPADLQAALLTDPLKARSGAFIVLAAAEIEFGLESACKRVAVLLRRASSPALSLVAWGFFHVKSRGASPKLSMRTTPVGELATAYETLLEANHGIKEKHLVNLLIPIGVDMGPLKTDILVLEDFG